MKKRTRNKLSRDFSKERDLDKLTIRERSRRMSLIRSRSTKFEQDFIATLKKQAKQLLEQIELLLASDSQWQQAAQHLLSIQIGRAHV